MTRSTGASRSYSAVLGQARGDLRAEAAVARRLVHDHAAAGLRDRFEDGVEVERLERGDVDHFGADAVLRQRSAASQRLRLHARPR